MPRIGAGGPFLVGQAPPDLGNNTRHLAQVVQALSLVSLGYFPPEEIRPPNHDVTHEIRSPLIGGHYVVPFQRVQLTRAEPQPQPYDHHSKLFFGRSNPVAAPSPGQPFFLWPPPPRIEEPPAIDWRADHTLLHRYRVGYQTVGQRWWLWQAVPKIEEPAPIDWRADHNELHLYRTGFQTVGQPWLTWPVYRPLAEIPELIAVPRTDLYPYRQFAPVITPTAGQPFFLWQPSPTIEEPPPITWRADHTQLHRYRFNFQTVGQPWLTWPAYETPPELFLPELIAPRQGDLYPFRQISVTTNPGQPWYLFKQPRIDFEPEVVRSPWHDLSPYRQISVATNPGQPWYLVKQPRIDFEPEVIRSPWHDLSPYRQITVATPVDAPAPPESGVKFAPYPYAAHHARQAKLYNEYLDRLARERLRRTRDAQAQKAREVSEAQALERQRGAAISKSQVSALDIALQEGLRSALPGQTEQPAPSDRQAILDDDDDWLTLMD